MGVGHGVGICYRNRDINIVLAKNKKAAAGGRKRRKLAYRSANFLQFIIVQLVSSWATPATTTYPHHPAEPEPPSRRMMRRDRESALKRDGRLVIRQSIYEATATQMFWHTRINWYDKGWHWETCRGQLQNAIKSWSLNPILFDPSSGKYNNVSL